MSEITKLKAPLTESDITKHWKYIDKVYVSVICTTFNQELYIRDAIESFLAQETEYKFEIIIHDDVSTDSTRAILKEYLQKYPSIIKLILQAENQFSINVNMPFKHALSLSEGEYVAICEGDDFWCDCKKIDLQINALSALPNIGLCFHPSYVSEEEKITNIKYNYSLERRNFTLNDMIYMGGGGCATNSLMIKKSTIQSLPSWFFTAHVGDVYIQIISSISGGALYLPYPMSVYRKLSEGSWTKNNTYHGDSATENIKKLKRTHELLAESYDCIDISVINRYIGKRYLEIALLKLKKLQIKGVASILTQSIIYLKLDFISVFFDIFRTKIMVENKC
ncbi:glycosyltransferase [Vibrio cyclitrophicus]|nr:hypothetical protein F0Z19_4832 [Vibrio cyclitrophicus]